MAVIVAPTKSNLIRAKATLSLSYKGFELLDQKRNILIREMMKLVERAKSIQTEIYSSLQLAYDELQSVNIVSGIKNVENIATGMPEAPHFDILLKSVMGTEIPIVKYDTKPIELYYGFHNTDTALDKATIHFRKVGEMIYELAQIDCSVFRLAKEIRKTQKRTHALQHIQIPKYKEQVKYIQEALEEKEREDFFRLKRVKKRQKTTKRS